MPIRIRSASDPHSRLSPSTHGHPSSALPSQSLSMVSHAIGGPSAMPGRTVESLSLQSGPQVAPLQHAVEDDPSPSASRKPSDSGLQSSSCPSQTSALPGYARLSASSQSSPSGAPPASTHVAAPWPSPSSSGGVWRHAAISSEHESSVQSRPSSQSASIPGSHAP